MIQARVCEAFKQFYHERVLIEGLTEKGKDKAKAEKETLEENKAEQLEKTFVVRATDRAYKFLSVCNFQFWRTRRILSAD